MNDLIQLPTVEQINLEHRLANSKASEAVQHATNCGLMLLQIKARLDHGEWLPWLNGEIESGRLTVKTRQVQKYMQLASNTHRSAYLLESPSIRAALELLSDKEPEAVQGALLDVAAERQARQAAEVKAETERKARELFERRAQESQAESNERRKKVRELEEQIDLLTTRDCMMQGRLEQAGQEIDRLATVVPEPEKVVVPPDDYETAKAKAAQLESELEALKKAQARLVNDQVKAKLHERQAELDKLEQDKQLLDEVVARKKAYLASLDSDLKRIETHQKVIEELRLKLLSLAVFLSDEDPVQDADTLKLWRALADMLAEAMTAVRQYSGESRPALSVVRGEVA